MAEYDQDPPVVPTNIRRLRACMRCHILKTESQWDRDNTCENCPFFGDLLISEFTTQNFEGFLGILRPQESWLAKYLNQTDLVIGSYALKIYQQFPEHTKQILRDKGIPLVRDQKEF